MKLQVILWFCLFLFGTETFAKHQHPEGKDSEESSSIKNLLSEFSDVTAKWSSLYQKFQGMETSECSSPENEIICESFRKEVNRMNDNLDRSPKARHGEMNPVLFSIQQKLEKIDRKIESGVGGNPLATRDHINAMKSLERRLRYFHTTVLNLEQEMKLPLKHQEREDGSLIEIDRDKLEKSSGRMYRYDFVTNMTKTCTQIMMSYVEVLQQLEHISNMMGGSSSGAALALRTYKNGIYKNSAFKDIKDMLENISDDIRSLKKMSSREMNENEKILKKINKKLEAELKDDDRDDEELKKSLKNFMVSQRKKLEMSLKKTLKDLKNKKDDGGDDDDDDDDDDDSDDDGDSSSKNKRKSKDDKDDDDDDDDSDDCNDSDNCEKSKKRKKVRDEDDSDEDDDDDDDDDDSDEDKKKGKKKSRNDSSDDTDDDDNWDDDDDDDDEDGDDDNDSDTNGKRNKNRKKNRENLARNKYLATESDTTNDVEMLKNHDRKSAAEESMKHRMFWNSFVRKGQD